MILCYRSKKHANLFQTIAKICMVPVKIHGRPLSSWKTINSKMYVFLSNIMSEWIGCVSKCHVIFCTIAWWVNSFNVWYANVFFSRSHGETSIL